MSRVLVPVVLDLTGLRILFVGAGEGTRMKLAALVDQDPQVRIVAPQIGKETQALLNRFSDAQVSLRPVVESDLDGVGLVYGLTDDQAVNAWLAQLCRARGLWSNVAHHRGGGSFTSPAVARNSGVIAAFSSEDGKPSMAVAARDSWQGGNPCTCP